MHIKDEEGIAEKGMGVLTVSLVQDMTAERLG